MVSEAKRKEEEEETTVGGGRLMYNNLNWAAAINVGVPGSASKAEGRVGRPSFSCGSSNTHGRRRAFASANHGMFSHRWAMDLRFPSEVLGAPHID